MTLVVTIFVGMGALLIISGLEDSPLIDTIKGVVSGQPIGAGLTLAEKSRKTGTPPPSGP